MTRTSNKAALLHIAVQDLHAGKRLLAERLPAIAAHVRDGELSAILAEEVPRAAAHANRLADTGVNMAGPKNLWMGGILDDADRDARSHDAGPLLDIALVGAVRKAKAAEIVSGETAVALARALEQPALLAALEANRTADRATDEALAHRLAALTGTR